MIPAAGRAGGGALSCDGHAFLAGARGAPARRVAL